jgi:hypothetical protein
MAIHAAQPKEKNAMAIEKSKSIPVGARRLLKLADYLDTVPDERFYYGTWVSGLSGRYDFDMYVRLTCGSTACALGHAATMPEFRKLGLKLRRNISLRGNGIVELKFKRHGVYYEARNEQAAKIFFKLDQGEVEYLFYPDWDGEGESPIDGLPAAPTVAANAKEVARHIRRFVNHKWGKLA